MLCYLFDKFLFFIVSLFWLKGITFLLNNERKVKGLDENYGHSYTHREKR